MIRMILLLLSTLLVIAIIVSIWFPVLNGMSLKILLWITIIVYLYHMATKGKKK